MIFVKGSISPLLEGLAKGVEAPMEMAQSTAGFYLL
jgi:hypothetical protein